MAHYRYKAQITDDIEDAREIIRNTGLMLQQDKIDKASALHNLARNVWNHIHSCLVHYYYKNLR